jgi:hypothetical protein
MKLLFCVYLVPLLTLSAWSQGIAQGTPPTPPNQTEAVVANLYKEVVARRPLGTPDRKIFGPYLSKKMLHGFNVNDACFDHWRRQNPDPDLKPPSVFIEVGFFSGANEEADPQTFYIEKIESRKDGSYRVPVKLTWEDASNKLAWHVVAVVVWENGQPVVDDVLYLKDNDRDIEYRLSKLLTRDCRGYR